MKKSMKKFIVACAAVSAITVAAGMSAMAAEYKAEDNSVTITVPAEAAADTQKTVLVIPKDKETSVTDADIYYINQDSTLPATALLKGDSLADGTYLVKVGYYKADGTFAIAPDEFTVGNNPGTEITVGDANAKGGVTTADAREILKYTADVDNYTGPIKDSKATYAAAAKSNKIDNTAITTADAREILKYTADVDNYSGPVGTKVMFTE